jgi:hypothetical protein
MELLAIGALLIICITGALACEFFFRESVAGEDRLYFAPAVGSGICAVVAYVASHTGAPWLILIFTLFCLGWFGLRSFHMGVHVPIKESSGLVRLVALTVLCVYAAQITLLSLFAQIHPGPHEVWTLFNLTGTPPPDQMFSWHQAMFTDQHRHYPRDPFYGDMDLYDRPHLGGYVTLFFFRLFHLQLTENNFTYPAGPLRFYHCLWWLLNDCYLLGVAALFKKLFGERMASLAVAATAVGGIFFLTTTGGWTKFAAAYPFLLALLLFARNRAPILQALLCVVSYYLHGSMLPFILGFGLLQLLYLYQPSDDRRFRDVCYFGAIVALLIGAWFVVVRIEGSKQPLLYYYIYDAALTQAQTEPVQQIARKFYARHTWASLSSLPLRNIGKSFFPWPIFYGWQLSGSVASAMGKIGSTLFGLQRFSAPCALGVVAAPLVLIGLVPALAGKHAGKIALCLYLVPTLFVALIYRKDWAFQLHIELGYHVLVLTLWAFCIKSGPRWFAFSSLYLIALEGAFCVLFCDQRFAPQLAEGIQHFHLLPKHYLFLAIYLLLIGTILGATYAVTRKNWAEQKPVTPSIWRAELLSRVAVRILEGMLVTGVVVSVYAIYCRRFY